jgi:hypothetical protein
VDNSRGNLRTASTDSRWEEWEAGDTPNTTGSLASRVERLRFASSWSESSVDYLISTHGHHRINTTLLRELTHSVQLVPPTAAPAESPQAGSGP